MRACGDLARTARARRHWREVETPFPSAITFKRKASFMITPNEMDSQICPMICSKTHAILPHCH
jgi:hypothetical protein